MNTKESARPLIGFIGQGWIGKNYADDFENRGYETVRFAKEEPYEKNGDRIADCDIVLIAVPTPTTPDGFDDSIVRAVVKYVGKGKIAVIKSTIQPGVTESIQKENPNIFVMHSPEFLREVTAAEDAANPKRNIVGIAHDSGEAREKAKQVLAVLPKAPFEKICLSKEAELVKYVGNVFLHQKLVFFNMVYDLTQKLNLDYDTVAEAVAADPRIQGSHMKVFYQGGRGSGGHCFIKDFAAFVRMYKEQVGDKAGTMALEGIEKKNIKLLLESEKDLDLLKGVYGDDVIDVTS